MSTLNEEHIEVIIGCATGNSALLAESFNQCFDWHSQLMAGESGPWPLEAGGAKYAGPGVLVILGFGQHCAVVAIPASLGLPGWYSLPSESQKSRLETLAMEWSMNLFPPQFEVQKFSTHSVASLNAAVAELSPEDWAAALEFSVLNDAAVAGSICLVWPLRKAELSPAMVVSPQAALSQSAPSPAVDEAVATQSNPTATADPLARLRSLPVSVSVRLAEKRMSVASLMQLSQGTLITFSKSCDDLLDLYVNNSIYARGEAVKIGENFGLKLNEVNSKPRGHESVILE